MSSGQSFNPGSSTYWRGDLELVSCPPLQSPYVLKEAGIYIIGYHTLNLK